MWRKLLARRILLLRSARQGGASGKLVGQRGARSCATTRCYFTRIPAAVQGDLPPFEDVGHATVSSARASRMRAAARTGVESCVPCRSRVVSRLRLGGSLLCSICAERHGTTNVSKHSTTLLDARRGGRAPYEAVGRVASICDVRRKQGPFGSTMGTGTSPRSRS